MKTKLYLICYDIADKKRLYKVRKVVYSFAFGGQKSAVESYLSQKDLEKLIRKLFLRMDAEVDRINIVEVEKDAILLGKAKQLPFDKGTVVI
ncbi:CRISPR-associated endonuclease Cas2 [Nitratiruptor tergarcus]|uniref:CRISPR-associated endoribonuclease Cas2 n=1 Tax=Nitratiruptor tergarcus DSM 16512 TaxID=1069081 RepID=A0A1W1WSI8_9BACT|nr:CRISPR-associated endonuclease Cas2 [Nitratiruptor tergarcus]SMC09206.1 CRISPR-associated endonuclease Cas2 [Nitratiruptor tergarcus DSM 16512]